MLRSIGVLVGMVMSVSAAMAQSPPGAAMPGPGAAAGALPPVETFFKRAKYTNVSLSPDGKLLAALVPTFERRNLALIDLEKNTATVLTKLKEQDVAWYRWIGDRTLEIATANLTDESGNIRLKQRLLVDTEGHVLRDTFRASLPRMRILKVLDRAGDDLIVETNERSRYSLDAYRYNPRTDARDLLTQESPGDVKQFVSDHDGQVRVAVSIPRGAAKTSLWYRKSNADRWTKLRETDLEDDTIRPIAFGFDNRTLYVAARSKTEGGRFDVYAFDPEANLLGKLLFKSDSIDGDRIVLDYSRKTVAGVLDDSLAGVHWIDPQWAAVQKSVDAALPGMRNRLSWGRYATERVVVTSESEAASPTYYLLDRRTGKLQELAASRPWLAGVPLSPRKLVRYRARDGLSIPAHLTLPRGLEEKKLPLVVVIHGGPYVNRAHFGYDAYAQFFASRGYAVLEPDYRGTQGYGDAFYKAGWRQWGLAMQDDVTDGVKWLIDSGKVDADRVCLFGGSYGGYATLWGLEKEPQMFRCGVAFVAVSDLEMMFDVGWSDFMRSERGGDTTRTLVRWIGDPDKDREKMRAVSPLYHADRIQAPLLLAYGAADDRVPLVHGTRMRAALDKYNKPYEWVVYDDEGHGFNKDENRYDFYRRVDAFLAKNLAPRGAASAAAGATTPAAPVPAISTAASPR